MAGDLHWPSASLAMHMDGADGSTAFIDVRGRAVAAVGPAQIRTAQSKFGGASAFFNGTTSALSVTADGGLAFGTGDFTIDLFVYPVGHGPYKSLVSIGNATTGPMLTLANGYLQWYASGIIAAHQTQLPLNTWTHVRACRSSGVLYLFCAGVCSSSTPAYTSSLSIGAAVAIGASTVGAAESFNGYLDDMRIYKGVALSIATFTPPAAAFLDYAGQLSGVVRDDTGTPCARTLRAYRRSDGALVGSTISDATTGVYALGTQTLERCTVVALDDTAGTQYNALVADLLTPA